MGLGVKLIVIGVFLLSTLGLCRAKNATVEVVGLMHCTDCIKNHSSTTNSSLGFEVMITCNANEMRARGNGGVDERGKFSVTLSAEAAEDSRATDGCYAKLQSRSGAPCHIQAAQTASVKILSNFAATQAVNITVLKFSPITCQSAFFWPFPNFTFFGSPPPAPPEYTPPPPPPVASPVQQPLPPPPQPSYDPPAPSLPPSVVEAPSPPPTYQNPTNPRIRSPSPPPQAPLPPLPPPPSSPVYSRPSPPPLPPPLNGPIQSPIPPKQTPNPTPPPTVISPTPAASSAPPPTARISIPPRRRRPSPIPKAPPIPRLPLTPSVPRKYFNSPKSRSKPPHSV